MRKGYKRAYIIPHGKSEYEFINFVKGKLRLPIEIYRSDKSGNGVQITDINSLLSNNIFKSNNFRKIGFNIQKKKLYDAKVFFVMDLDRKPEKNNIPYDLAHQFKHGLLYDNSHWLFDSIISIYNDDDLEEVLRQIDLPYAKRKKEKGNYNTMIEDWYTGKIEQAEKTVSPIAIMEDLADKFRKIPTTNMEILLDYLIELAKENKRNY